MYQKIKNTGFTLIEIIIGLGLSAAVVLGSAYLITNTFEVQKNEDQMYWLEERRNEIMMTIQNDQNWTQLMGLNPQMNCATTPEGCAEYAAPQRMTLKLNGSQLLDGTNPALGLSKKGDFCYQFDAVNGHALCTVGISLTWQPLCLDSSCIQPQFKIDVAFQHKDSGKSASKNLHHFNMSFYSDAKAQNLYDLCTSMGGVLVGTNCQITAFNTTCDPANSSGTGATFALGFDANGAVICGQPGVNSCAATEFLTGFNADGSSICTNGCTAPPPPVSGVPQVNCVGSWGPCNATGTCGTTGKRFYTVTIPAANGGLPCPYSTGAQQTCSTPACPACTTAPCFVAGTPVLMADGKYKAIEKIQAGDRVVSFDEHGQTQRADQVLYTTAHKKQWQQLHHFELADGTKLTSNDVHPFYIVEKDYWFEASEIFSMFKQGQTLSFLNVKGEAVLIKKLWVERKNVPVYNLEVKGINLQDEKYGKWGRGHNYYVKGILTHNKRAARTCSIVPPDPDCTPCDANETNVNGICIYCAPGKTYIHNPTGHGQCCPQLPELIE